MKFEDIINLPFIEKELSEDNFSQWTTKNGYRLVVVDVGREIQIDVLQRAHDEPFVLCICEGVLYLKFDLTDDIKIKVYKMECILSA